MNEITAACPLSDDQAAGLVSSAALLEVRESIIDVPLSRRDRAARGAEPAPARKPPQRSDERHRRGTGRRAGRGPRPRVDLRLQAPLRRVVVGALAAAVIAVIALAASGTWIGSVHVGAQSAQALAFTRHGGQLTVTVRNPLASPATFRRQLTEHHLRIHLQLIKGSPSIVGTVAYIDENADRGAVQVIQAKGRCRISAIRDYCPVGVRVPVGYRGSVSLGFVVPTPPGTPYETAGPATAPGEAMHGLHYIGRTVTQVLTMLKHRHVSVQSYRHTTHHGHTANTHLLHADQVPRTWRVFLAVPWAEHQVILFVGASAASQGFK